MPDFNVNTTLSNTSGNDLSPEIKAFYRTELLEEGKPSLVHTQFGTRRPLPKGNGKSIEWRRWDAFPKAMTPLTEGVTPDGNAINVRYVTQELRQYGDYTTLSDQLELTAVDDVILEATDNHARNMALTIDCVTRNELLTGENVIYAPIAAADGSLTAVTSRGQLTSKACLTPAVVAQAANLLKTVNAPKFDGSYVAIVHPAVACDLLRHPEFVETHKYGPGVQNLYDGEVGKLYGVRFVETTEAKVYKEGKDGAPVFVTFFVGKGAYGCVDLEDGADVIIKQRGSAGSGDPLDQRSSVGWKATFAAKILMPEYLIRVESGSEAGKTLEAN